MPPHNAPTKELHKSLDFQTRLNAVMQRIHDGGEFSAVMPEIESDLRNILNCERITVYRKGRNEKEIISKYKSGTEIKEIRIPLSPSSIAGYVAMSKSSVAIVDAYSSQELEKIHPRLKFSQSFDKQSGFRTRAVLAVPIKWQEVLLGVLQLLNKTDGTRFSTLDVQHAEMVAKVLGQKFRYELHGTKSPFEYLVLTNRIKDTQLEEYKQRAERENTPLFELLLKEAQISRLEIGRSLEQYYQVPFMIFDPAVKIPRELLSGISDSYLLKSRWVPIHGDRNEAVILVDDPSDAEKIMEIQRIVAAQNYSFRVGLPDDILRFLGQNAGAPESSADIHELVGRLQSETIETEDVAVETVDENAATVIQLVNRLIQEAYDARASDIHIEPGRGKSNTNVRFRVDGSCRASLTIPASHSQAVRSRIKIVSGLDISERRKPQDGKCLVKVRGQPVELRVATLPTVNGESVVMRILAASEPLPLNKLNLSTRNLTELETILQRPHGLFLVVGPTGSGKTTTLHAVLGHMNSPERKIWTAEDPVEITQPGLNQVQVNAKIGLTFAIALRSFLRADPDVIMIGEMRDHETAHAGIEASLTGHLVFSTLHTNSAAETVVRLLDLGLDPVSFADAFLGVLAQRLVRTLCVDCKKERPLTEEEFKTVTRYYGEAHVSELNIEVGKTKVFGPSGCPKCSNTGYRGRTGVHELLVASDEIRGLVMHKGTAVNIRDVAMREGMRTLMQDGISKFLQGQTDLEQVKKVAAS